MRSDIAVLLVCASLFGPAGHARADQQAATGVVATVQQAKQLPTVTMPDLVRMTRQEAEAVLLKHGLRLDNVTEVPPNPDSSVGAVIWQDPPAGKQVARGTAVKIRIVGQWPGTPATKGVAPSVAKAPKKALATAPVGVKVPRLLGLEVGPATKTAEGSRLHLGTITQLASDRPAGTIIGQNPVEGTEVIAGSAIDISVAVQKPQTILVPVPDLLNMTIGEARDRLARVKLLLRAVEPAKIQVEPGTVVRVVSQVPKAGTNVPPGTGVVITVRAAVVPPPPDTLKTFKGATEVVQPVRVKVPRLLGLEVGPATKTAAGSRLRLGTITQLASDRPAGTIIGQNPVEGTEVSPGSAIDVTVAEPRPPQTIPVAVPDLLNLTIEEARDRLAQAKLRLGPVSRPPQFVGVLRVVRQSPAPGTNVTAGTAVRIVVRGQETPPPPPPVEVPELVGRRDTEVATILEGSGLVTGSVERRPDIRPRGTVISQRPARGTSVPRGSSVDVLVVDPQLAVVPALETRRIEDARELCAKAGLQLAFVRRVSDATAGTIVSQAPQPGERVAVGSTVNVVVAIVPPVAPPPPTTAPPKAPPPATPPPTTAPPTTPPATTPPPPTTPPVTPEVETVVVPDLTGLLLAEGQRITESVGLGIELTSEMTEGNAARRRIASQQPAPRSRVKKATLVTVRLGPPPFPWLLVGGAFAAAGLAGVLAWRWWVARVPPLNVEATGSSPACDLDMAGGLIDLEMRMDVKREPGWQASDATGASIIRETRPGVR